MSPFRTSICSKHVENKLMEINLLRKLCILLVFLTYVYQDARYRKCKIDMPFFHRFFDHRGQRPDETWRHMRRNQIWSLVRNGPVHLKRPGGRGVSSVDCRPAEVCGISGSNAGYTMFRGSAKSTAYPLHSSVSTFTSPLPYVTVCPSHFSWSLIHSASAWGSTVTPWRYIFCLKTFFRTNQ